MKNISIKKVTHFSQYYVKPFGNEDCVRYGFIIWIINENQIVSLKKRLIIIIFMVQIKGCFKIYVVQIGCQYHIFPISFKDFILLDFKN